MSDNRLVLDPRNMIRRDNLADLVKDPQQIDDFIEIVTRAYQAKKPAADDLKAIRKFLQQYPEMCPIVFDLAEVTQQQTINVMTNQKPARIAMEEQIAYIRRELGYNRAPMMERLLIENIVTAWLFVQRYETTIAMMQGQQSMRELEFWERRLSLAQRRYLAACESLAKIRKMDIPALQLNIGNKQINVAGKLQTKTIEPAPEIIEGEIG